MNILVCIADKKNAGSVLKNVSSEIDTNDKVYLLNIASYEMYYLHKTEEENELDYLYDMALEVGAEVMVVRSNNVLRSTLNIIEEYDIDCIYVEESRELRQLRNIEEHYSVEGRNIKCIYLEL